MRPLWLLNSKNKFSSDRIYLRDDKFKIETCGYWKKLSPEEIGTNKKGRQITGKTWVNKTESYYQANTDELIIQKELVNQFSGEESGLIYIMRNGNLDKYVYKIGFTRNSSEERAKQLSKTSIPDNFYVMRDWVVLDCVAAEKEIHDKLAKYRVDPRREFFKLEMKIANQIIQSVVDGINETPNTR